MKNNIRKILSCLIIIYMMILFVYCSQSKNVIEEQTNNQIVNKARMYNINYLIHKEHLDKLLSNRIRYKESDDKVKRTKLMIQEEKVVKEIKKEDVIKLTSYEIDLLERLVMGEAEGEPLEGKIAVAQVVFNRVKAWDKTVKEVIYQKHQFTSTINGRMDIKPNKDSIKAVKLAIKGTKTSITTDTLYFYAPDECNSRWHERKLEYVTTIGGHKFFREK